MMKKIRLLLLIASVCLTAACRHVLPEDRMVALLTDMYLYEEELTRGIQGADSVSIYRSVFIRHGCSEEEYRTAVACYAKKPKVMKEIYEAVKLRLEGYKTEFEHTLQLEDSLRNLWISPYDTLFQSTEIPPRAYAFSIAVDTLCTYTLSVSAQYFEDDSTQRPRMTGYLLGKFGTKDTIQGAAQVAKIRKSLKEAKASRKVIKTQIPDTVRQEKEVEFARGETKTYTLSFTVDDTLVTHIRGFWLLADKRDSTVQQHIYLSKFRVHKPRDTQSPLMLKPLQPIEHFQALP